MPSHRQDDACFAAAPAVKQPGVVDIRLRLPPYQRALRDLAPFTSAQSATAVTSASSTAATVGVSAGASVQVDFARRVTNRSPSAICFQRHQTRLRLRRKGGRAPSPPHPLTPAPSAHDFQRRRYQPKTIDDLLRTGSFLMAASVQIGWPPLFSFAGHLCAGPTGR